MKELTNQLSEDYKMNPMITIYQNEVPMGQGLNLWNGITKHILGDMDCDDTTQEVCVVVDGDDRLIHSDALKLIMEQFESGKLIVNARMKSQGDYRNLTEPIDFSDLRNPEGWNSVHPRCFRADLFINNLEPKDFLYKRWIVPTASDLIWWLTPLEAITDPETQYGFINEDLYMYNDQLPDNDHRGPDRIIQDAYRKYLLETRPKPKYRV